MTKKEDEADALLEPGQMVRQYVVQKLLGAGFSGTVYLVRHRFTGRLRALKVMREKEKEDPTHLSRSMAEALGTYAIQHKNVVEVVDLDCEEDGTVLMFMEYLEGRTLTQFLAERGKPLSAPLALFIAIEMAHGVRAAHENQTIHRDIKPDNVMLTGLGAGEALVVKVLDFSIAKLLQYRTKTTQREIRLGTAAYMSPENLRGHAPDARLDIYALGVVLHQMLTGDHPFHDCLQDRERLVKAQLYRDPAPLSVVAGLPTYADDVMRGLIAKDPDQRYFTMVQVIRALTDLLQRLLADVAAGRVVLAMPPGEPPVPTDPNARRDYHPPQPTPELEGPATMPSARIIVATPQPAPSTSVAWATPPLPPVAAIAPVASGTAEPGPWSPSPGGTLPIPVQGIGEAAGAGAAAEQLGPRGTKVIRRPRIPDSTPRAFYHPTPAEPLAAPEALIEAPPRTTALLGQRSRISARGLALAVLAAMAVSITLTLFAVRRQVGSAAAGAGIDPPGPVPSNTAPPVATPRVPTAAGTVVPAASDVPSSTATDRRPAPTASIGSAPTVRVPPSVAPPRRLVLPASARPSNRAQPFPAEDSKPNF